MTDLLVRNLSDETVAAIDSAAARAGVSRAEWLRRTLESQVQRETVTVADLARFSELASDLADPDVMQQAWS
ncbi:MAG TPA: ribbon-helix-helix protein, CopG family [Arachnia sp.]|nr:ribbon-helix-helix protein, CopG family [Arachnia sp.]HMT85414.1 ribbon-helix-helix protein, CopG family [Arachnia sp.]